MRAKTIMALWEENHNQMTEWGKDFNKVLDSLSTWDRVKTIKRMEEE